MPTSSKADARRAAFPSRQNQLVAAHRDFPFGTVLRVTNTRNDRAVNVRVVDRGPFGAEQTIIDLSRRAAQQLGYIEAGRTPVQVEVLEWGTASRPASDRRRSRGVIFEVRATAAPRLRSRGSAPEPEPG
jgi:rare lipoprotein A